MSIYLIGSDIPLSFVKNTGNAPVTGLSVTVSVTQVDTGATLLAATAMTEVAPGLYVYVWVAPGITTTTDILANYTVLSTGFQSEEFHSVMDLSTGGGGSGGGIASISTSLSAAVILAQAQASASVLAQASAVASVHATTESAFVEAEPVAAVIQAQAAAAGSVEAETSVGAIHSALQSANIQVNLDVDN